MSKPRAAIQRREASRARSEILDVVVECHRCILPSRPYVTVCITFELRQKSNMLGVAMLTGQAVGRWWVEGVNSPASGTVPSESLALTRPSSRHVAGFLDGGRPGPRAVGCNEIQFSDIRITALVPRLSAMKEATIATFSRCPCGRSRRQALTRGRNVPSNSTQGQDRDGGFTLTGGRCIRDNSS